MVSSMQNIHLWRIVDEHFISEQKDNLTIKYKWYVII